MRYQPTLFFLAAIFLLCSCQRENEYSSHRYHMINASLGDSGTRTTFESQAGSYDLLTKWQGHEYIKVFLNVDDAYNDAVRTVQVSKISADGSGATFSYKVPDEWGESDSYKVKMFTSTCLPAIKDGKVYYNASLIREPISSFQVPVYSEGEIIGEGVLNATFHHYYTYELLHIKNTSNEDISFTLLGFEDGTWFKQKGSLCIDDGSFVVNAPSTKEPVTTTTVTVKAQESETIVSAYIPTGQPIQMARMVAQVNGQDVKSMNTKSSGVELKTGHAYHMYAGWNGKELKFWSNEEAPLDVETRSAAFDPVTFSGLFTGAVTNLTDGGVKSVGFRFWRDEDPEDYVEFDATLADDNTFSLILTYNELLEIAGDASVKGSYKVSAFALKPDGSRFHGEILEFTIDKEKPDLPTVPVPEMVDLGLPSGLMWASCNLGASKPEEYGYYYAWGETEPKDSYFAESYKWMDADGKLIKYCNNPDIGIVDNRETLDLEDDAAHVHLGGQWRMPTRDEMNELMEFCSWTWTMQNGLRGRMVTGPNGNSIFLPAAGAKNRNDYFLTDGYGYYWTSSLFTNDFYDASNLYFYSGHIGWGHDRRYAGFPIRPVFDKSGPLVHAPEVVDLGLSVKWASMNLGATKPDECGEYYAWGETVPKTNYSWESYRFGHEASSESMTKYNSTDGLNILLPEDDAAHVLLKGDWRMPTYDEWYELKKQCEWVEIKQGGAIVGYTVTSKVNGASITLPTAGYKDGMDVKNANTARYWYSSLTNGNNLTKARNHNESCYYSDWSGMALYGDDRSFGMQIRPVYDDHSDLIIQDDGFVDMGLSVEWASRNIGAGSLDEIGHVFSWGDVQPGSSFTWPSYRFGTQEALTKYNELDGKKVLDREDDIVYLTYKGNHRIPTKTEWDELWNNCLSRIIVIKGRRGYLLTSKINNRSIFLPFTGYLDDHQLHDGMQSRYWSSSLTNGNNLSKARNLKEACYYSDWSGLGLYGDDRCFGMPIRGIRATNEATLSPGEMIDLGLSVKWASCNMGASSPEESGCFYSWGELESKSDYTWDNYKFCMDQTGEWLVKYNTQDGRQYLEGSDDIVHKTKGGSWRMPTSDDWRELKDNCQWNEATLNGVRGYHIISKVNGNSIFLPRTGYMDGTQLKDTEKPRYWSSSMTNGTNLSKARNLNESCYYSDWSGMAYYGDDRYLGMPVRGVFDDYVESSLTDGSAIDMGVSVRWARTNVGADQPEGKGYFFGWGEVTTRIDYTWGAYKYSADGTSSVMKKYNDLDKKTVLDYSDDAAYTVSSGEFRMPTIDEWRELMNNTTHEIKIKNGQVGYLLTSKINGNTIFLPFVGYYDGKEFNDGMRPRYWSSSLTNGNNISKARNLNESCYYSDWSGLAFYGDDRYLGMPVRGVKL